MAIERGGTTLVQQSASRISRGSLRSLRQDIARKGGAPIGGEAIQAFAEGELEQQRLEKGEQARLSLIAQQNEEDRRLREQQFQQQQVAARRERKAGEQSDVEAFFSGLFSS